MSLLDEVISAHDPHGRRSGFSTVEADIVTGGGLFPLKGLPSDPDTRRMTVWLHELRASITPFGGMGQRSAFTTDRVAVERMDGSIVVENTSPLDMFAGHGLGTAWGPLHRAYFNGYALWTYLNTPFLLAMPGVVVEELPEWRDAGETWRVLRAWFPGRMITHSAHQEFYFGPDLMLRRHDYSVDIAGRFKAAHLTTDYAEANGIKFPTRRRAHARGPDNRAIEDLLMVSIDISNVAFD